MDFALFLLIFLAFYTSGQLLTKRLLGLKFADSVEVIQPELNNTNTNDSFIDSLMA